MLKLYNTYSRQKEDFKKIDGTNVVKIYTCGPTVYNFAHIGNLRAYIFMDVLRKVLKYNGYELKHVMNITDVGHMTSDADEGEDKMLKTARLTNMKPEDIAKKYTDAFMQDIKELNIETPEIIAKATDHIKEMEEYVAKIVANGFGYETSKGIYYDTQKDEKYGELSRVNLSQQKAGARIRIDGEKNNPLDFALWIKAPENHLMKWESRWGMCYPGWHIECSAMSNKYLGNVIDIHTGGVDHIPIHHENEIAQSRGYNGLNPARFWMHSEFLLIDGGKMSKSLGNIYTISDIKEKGFSPLSYRYLSYTSHYRNKLNFTWNALENAESSLIKLKNAYKEHNETNRPTSPSVLRDAQREFEKAINDDLNMPVAMSVVWNLAKLPKSSDVAQVLLEMDKILSLDIDKPLNKKEENLDIPEEVNNILNERAKARENKDFAMSDKLRDKLLEMGYKVLDTKDGQKLEKKD